MKIENLKELQEVIQACRKLGVFSLKLNGIELQLGELPVKSKRYRKELKKTYNITENTSGMITSDTHIPDPIDMPNFPTEEEMLFYSSEPQAGEQQ